MPRVAGPGRPRISDEEKRRRGTFRPDQKEDRPKSSEVEEPDDSELLGSDWIFKAPSSPAKVRKFFREVLKHQKGEFAGRPLTLDPWQNRDIVNPVFGTKLDGLRQYRTVWLEVPRKNGKTTVAAGVGIYLLFGDNEAGAEIYIAASDRGQAGIAYAIARRMVEGNPALRAVAKVYRNAIVFEKTGSTLQVISADARSKHGYNAHGIILDEVHAQPNRELYDVLHTSTGARRQPLEFLITTAGIYEPQSIAWQLHDYALKVQDGAVEDPTFLPVIYGAPITADYRDIAVHREANPGYGVSVKAAYLEAEAKRAEAEPSYENTFRRLHLNQWTQQITRWIKIEDWQACARALPDLTGRECFPALDLSSTTDLSALSLVFPPEEPDEPTWVLPFFWVPENAIMRRAGVDRVPYDAWVRDGHITATPGDVVDYSFIRHQINELSQQYRFNPLAYDPWNAMQIAVQLSEEDGIRMIEHRQGYISMNEPAREFERLVVSRRLAHPDNPVLNWMVANVTVRRDPSGNIKPDKEKSTGRIDGVVATVMGVGQASRQTQHEPTIHFLSMHG